MNAPLLEDGSEILYRLAGPVLGGATESYQNSPPVEQEPLNGHSNVILLDSDDDSEDFVALGANSPPTAAIATEEDADSGGGLELVKDSLPLSVPPWMEPINARGSPHSTLLQLHQAEGQGSEIVSFCDFIAPSEEEAVVRLAAVQRVSDVVTSIWPQCAVKVFGSYATGLYLPASDCDVVVEGSGLRAPVMGLRALAKKLQGGGVGTKLQVISKAKVPIVKFVEKESGISFDISFDATNGPEAASFIKSALADLPPLRPLCLVLKIFLQQRELNEVFTGGIGSYALLAMIMAHLQLHASWTTGRDDELEGNLGVLLVDFLEMYGRTLNMREVGVSCRGGGQYFSKREHWYLRGRGLVVSSGADRRSVTLAMSVGPPCRPSMMDDRRPFLLAVEDPQDSSNDLGRSSHGMSRVRSALMHAHRLLTPPPGEKWDRSVGLLARIIRLDKVLVGRPMPPPQPAHSPKSSKSRKSSAARWLLDDAPTPTPFERKKRKKRGGGEEAVTETEERGPGEGLSKRALAKRKKREIEEEREREEEEGGRKRRKRRPKQSPQMEQEGRGKHREERGRGRHREEEREVVEKKQMREVREESGWREGHRKGSFEHRRREEGWAHHHEDPPRPHYSARQHSPYTAPAHIRWEAPPAIHPHRGYPADYETRARRR